MTELDTPIIAPIPQTPPARNQPAGPEAERFNLFTEAHEGNGVWDETPQSWILPESRLKNVATRRLGAGGLQDFMTIVRGESRTRTRTRTRTNRGLNGGSRRCESAEFPSICLRRVRRVTAAATSRKGTSAGLEAAALPQPGWPPLRWQCFGRRNAGP
jgi:hypothetical protein